MSEPFFISDACKRFLASLVITSIESVFRASNESCPPLDASLDEEEKLFLSRHLGSFVTLTLHGNLRGCIGSIVGYEPLFTNVWRMARSAAFSDPRFRPLNEAEWKVCEREISVLSEVTLCPDPTAISIGQHGLVLRFNGRTGVFLPQVPVEQHWNRTQYLDHLCLKAGVAPGSWKNASAELFWFEATVFAV